MSESEQAEPEQPKSDLLAERREKLERLRAEGVEPFPHSFPGRTAIADVHTAHDGLADGEETESSYRVAGRLWARRGHGKAAFLDMVDGTGRLQLHARADVLGEESLDGLLHLDLGDIAGVEGVAFKTRRGELSLRVDSWMLLAKSLRPPPDKFHGLEDVETRYRRRELDLTANADVRELFRKRAAAITATREWFDGERFVEVETPVLQPLYGGALARPFTTHHNALDRDLYLRIATELYLKRCIVGGLDRVFELGKDFRNEGIDFKHNPEFTMLEWYEAYADYTDTAERLERLVAHVAERVNGTTKVERDGVEIDLAPPWRRVTLRDAIRWRRRWTPSPIRRRAGASSSTACSPRRSSPSCGSPPSSSITPSSSPRSRSGIAPSPAWWSAGRRSRAGWSSPTRSPSSTTPTSSADASSSRRRS
jgi:lysyl-tRNA synthetase class 2